MHARRAAFPTDPQRADSHEAEPDDERTPLAGVSTVSDTTGNGEQGNHEERREGPPADPLTRPARRTRCSTALSSAESTAPESRGHTPDEDGHETAR